MDRCGEVLARVEVNTWRYLDQDFVNMSCNYKSVYR
jgi:hypothetical protein